MLFRVTFAMYHQSTESSIFSSIYLICRAMRWNLSKESNESKGLLHRFVVVAEHRSNSAKSIDIYNAKQRWPCYHGQDDFTIESIMENVRGKTWRDQSRTTFNGPRTKVPGCTVYQRCYSILPSNRTPYHPARSPSTLAIHKTAYISE